MATNTERFQAIMENLKNDTVDGPTLARIADYFVILRSPEIEAAGLDPDNLTVEQKARVGIDYYRSLTLSHVRRALQRDLVVTDTTVTTALEDFDETP
jgi:hypothetical protein